MPNHLIKEEDDEEEDEDNQNDYDSNEQFSTHSQIQDQSQQPLQGRNFQELFNQVKKKYANDNMIAIPKNDFQNLIDKLQYDVAKEIERKRVKEDIEKETLADYYVNQKIQEFNVQVKKPKQKKPKKNKRNNGQDDDDPDDYELNGQDEIQQMSQEEMLEKQKLQLSLGELKNILHQFEKDMHQRIDFKQGNAVFDAIDQERQSAEYMESYDTFVHLLHYYYNYDINAYKALIDEYNFRYHNMLFQKLGLGMQTSNNSVPPQNQEFKGQNRNPQDDQQQQQSMLPKDILQLNNSGDNSSFISQQNNNNTSKPTKPLVGFNQSASFSKLGVAGSQVVAKGNTNNQTNQKSWMLDSSVMGQNYNQKLIEDQEKRILVERYGKTFTEGDIRKLRSGNILSEEGLNFFIKFLDERQDHQMYIFKINQKQFPRGMRLLFLSSNFYTYFTKNDPLQVDRLDFVPVRAYMKSFAGQGQTIFEKFDKICIPIQLRLAEMHLAVIDFLRKEIVLYITSEFNDYPPKPVNNPINQNLLRFIQKELYEKKLQNLNFISWQHRYVYLDDSLRQAHKQSVLNTAYVVNILSKQREYEKESNDLFYAFHERLVRLFLQIGITKNTKNELIFENLPL